MTAGSVTLGTVPPHLARLVVTRPTRLGGALAVLSILTAEVMGIVRTARANGLSQSGEVGG